MKLPVNVIIQCRYGSTRLPGKALYPLCGTTLLGFLIKRLKAALPPEDFRIIVATTKNPEDNPIAAWAEHENVCTVRGSEEDVLSRYILCLQEFPSETHVRVTADNPLTCPSVLKDCVALARQNNLDYVQAVDFPYGTGVDVFSASLLEQLVEKATSPRDREHINDYVLTRPEQFDLDHLTAPPFLNRPDLRMTVDTPEDFENISSLLSLLPQHPEPWTITLEKAVHFMNKAAPLEEKHNRENRPIWKIPLFDLDFTHEEEQAVREVIQSKWLTSGDKTTEFEKRFAEYLGPDVQSCAVSSGTAALHISLLACGIKPGDEVIIPALTFVADINVVLMTGAVPVLADIKSFTDWNISPEDVANKITSKTKAVIAVHYAGWPCDMDELTDICKQHNLWLIEDAAHAPGAVYKEKKCGAIGDIGCFSFFSNKNLSTGEGGMITSRHSRHILKARLLRSHGMTRSTMERYQGRSLSYDVAMPGLNYRIDELKSALGLIQLTKLDRNNSKRLGLVHDYIKHAASIKKMTIPWKNFPQDRQGTGHIFPIMLDETINRKQFMDFLKLHGIQTSIHYPGFNEFSFYSEKIDSFPEIAATVSSRMVTLPLYPGLTKNKTRLICTKIAEFLNQESS